MEKDTLPVLPFDKAASNSQNIQKSYKLVVNHEILDLVLDDLIAVELSLQCFAVPKRGISGKMSTEVNLNCQRTGEVYKQPIIAEFKLFHESENEDECMNLDDDSNLCIQSLIEEEILLALPLVPIKPGTDAYLDKYCLEKADGALSKLKDLVN